jgi:hypothetical protein
MNEFAALQTKAKIDVQRKAKVDGSGAKNM